MQFLLGLLCGVAFLACLYGAYQMGRRQRKPTPPKETDNEQKQRMERLQAGFQQLMSYDVPTALRGKR